MPQAELTALLETANTELAALGSIYPLLVDVKFAGKEKPEDFEEQVRQYIENNHALIPSNILNAVEADFDNNWHLLIDISENDLLKAMPQAEWSQRVREADVLADKTKAEKDVRKAFFKEHRIFSAAFNGLVGHVFKNGGPEEFAKQLGAQAQRQQAESALVAGADFAYAADTSLPMAEQVIDSTAKNTAAGASI